MAEDFAIQGIESKPTRQAGSAANEALFLDAYDRSKCMGGGPGSKCGAPGELPSLELSTTQRPAEQESERRPQNNYPGVYFDLSSLSNNDNYRAGKQAEKERILAEMQKEEQPRKENPSLKESQKRKITR